MSIAATLLPVFVQVFLAFILLMILGAVRFKAVAGKETTLNKIALDRSAWPQYALKVSNSFQNQLEMPVFFYLIVVLAILTQKNDFLFIALSWVFVGSRIAHACVHATSNYIPARFSMFLIGVGALMTMWVIFALKILFPIG